MKVQDGRYEVGSEIGPAGANGQDEGSSTESQSHMKVLYMYMYMYYINNNKLLY